MAGMRTGQPTEMAGDTLRVIMDMGKFQGVMAPTTPTGCLITTGRLLPDTVCSTSPFTLLHSSANHSMDAALRQEHTHASACNPGQHHCVVHNCSPIKDIPERLL